MKKPIVLLLGVILGLVNLSGQDTEIWKDKRANLDLLNFLDAKMITGYNVESDLSFQFWRGSFPELEVNSPATMNKFMGGDYSVDIRWFDTYLQEVDSILRPGRYGYYAEITGASGIVMKRAGLPMILRVGVYPVITRWDTRKKISVRSPPIHLRRMAAVHIR